MQKPQSAAAPAATPIPAMAESADAASGPFPAVFPRPSASPLPGVAEGPAATAEALRRAQLRRQLQALLADEPTGHPTAP